MSAGRQPCRTLGLALLLFAAICEASTRAPRTLREDRRLQSSCPTDPLALCDFHFSGYSSSLPLISLDGAPDRGVGPFIVSSKSGRTVQVGSTGDGSLLCSGKSAGNQFYANGQQAQVRFRSFTQLKSMYENQCIILPLRAIQIGSLNLNWGDSSQGSYPNTRRCVVFKTGPSANPLCGTAATKPETKSLPPPPKARRPPPPKARRPPPPKARSPPPKARSPPPKARTPPPSKGGTFSAIFTFGDSTADVGTNDFIPNTTVRANVLPYGQDFIPASGRFSNGRLVVDYIGERFGLPAAPPFLEPNANFKYGANFASGASGFLDTTSCLNNTRCISLSLQLAQFASIQSRYPPQKLAASLFLLSTGGNDYLTYLNRPDLQANFTVEQYVIKVVNGLGGAIQALYQRGARKFLVSDVAAVGCIPVVLLSAGVPPSKPACVEKANLVAAGHKQALEQVLALLRAQLPGAHIVEAKSFDFFLAVAAKPAQFGFETTSTACCGGGTFNAQIQCGTPGSTVCRNPEKYFFWDRIHATQAAYRLIANSLFTNTSFVAPYGIDTLAKK